VRITDEQKNCNHDFEIVRVYGLANVEFKEEIVEVSVSCKKCHLPAREVYAYSCTLNEDNKEV
jgi:C4-type Zn-finger protein